MTEDKSPKQQGQAPPASNEGRVEKGLVEGQRGVVVMPTQAIQPLAPSDIPTGLPPAPQNLAPDASTPPHSESPRTKGV